MTKALSTARFIALLSLRVDLGKPTRIPDPLPKAKAIVISDWPRKNAQLLLRLIRALAGKDEVFSLRDVDGMSHETLSIALALTVAGIHGAYSKAQWQASARSTEKAVRASFRFAVPAERSSAVPRGCCHNRSSGCKGRRQAASWQINELGLLQ